jgi:hypothetical protein
MSDGYLYELATSAPARFRARGLDAAHRVSRRVHDAVRVALENDPEVILVEDEAYFDERPMPCDGEVTCRAALHAHGCLAPR